MNTDRLYELFEVWAESRLTPSEASELSTLLRADGKALALFREATAFNGQLHLAIDEMNLEQASTFGDVVGFPVRSRILGIAAAFLVVGLTCLSLGWLLASPADAPRVKHIEIHDGNFELVQGATAAGFPKTVFAWGGDPNDVTVTDATHHQSLRFIAAAGEPNVPNSPQQSCDIFQIIDLKFLQPETLDGRDAFVELNASFLDLRTLPGDPIRFICKVYVFEGDPTNLAELWPPSAEQIIGGGAKFFISEATGIPNWKRVTARCVLPPNAGFLVVQIGAGNPDPRGKPSPRLGKQFVDDISLHLHTRQPQPISNARK